LQGLKLILGQDPWVFAAWLGCILSTLLCIFHWIYYEYVRKEKLFKEVK